jgi:hypothetical protein
MVVLLSFPRLPRGWESSLRAHWQRNTDTD